MSVRPPRPVLLSVLALLFVGLGTTAFAQRPRPWRRCLSPSGGDDTATLQAALDRCSGARGRCTVDLCAGTFETGILRVRDFRGSVQGAGPQATVLRALPELPVNDNPDGYFFDDPFDPSRNPWPYLLQFVGGDVTLDRLAIEVPTPAQAGQRPTTGWFFYGFEIDELVGAVLFTGQDPVDFTAQRLRVEAGVYPEGLLGTTTEAGVSFEGLIFDPTGPADYPVFPVRGSGRITDSAFSGLVTATSLAELDRAQVFVARNDFHTMLGVDLIDADRSQIAVFANDLDVDFGGVQLRLNLDGPPSTGNEILVSANRGRVAAGHAVFFQDPFDTSREPGGSQLRVTNNTLTLGSASASAASGVTATGASGLRVAGNRFSGAASTGIDLDVTEGCRVYRNSLQGLATSPGPDLHLGPGTTDCVAFVGRADVVVDEGVANRIVSR
jgi:hypothetical protein